MPDISPSGNSTHPLGWAFLGAGAAIWLLPLLQFLGVDLAALLPADGAVKLAVIAVGASVLGIIAEYLLSSVETILLDISGLKEKDPGKRDKDAWSLAWQARWKYANADAEFRRYEALISFARAYMVHFVLGGAFWAIAAFRMQHVPLAIAALVLGLLSAYACYRFWYRRTSLIFILVQSAAAWTRAGAL